MCLSEVTKQYLVELEQGLPMPQMLLQEEP